MHIYRFTFTGIAAIALLTACNGGTVKDTLGINRKAPDEYRVVTRPPLSVPPQFNLRAPLRPGEATESQAASRQAESVLLGKPEAAGGVYSLPAAGSAESAPVAPVRVEDGASSPESNFLERAGAVNADPSVRQQLEEDRIAKQEVIEESSWWETFSILPEKKEPLVNAKGEADRLEKNKQEGKPVTEGETPEVKQKDRGVLGRIFGD